MKTISEELWPRKKKFIIPFLKLKRCWGRRCAEHALASLRCIAALAAGGRCVGGKVLGMGKWQAAVPVSGRARMYSEARKRGGWGEEWVGGWVAGG